MNTVVGKKFLHSRITQRKTSTPLHTQNHNQLDLEFGKMSGELLMERLISRCETPQSSGILLLSLNCEELHELCLSCVFYTIANHLFGPGNAIFLLTLALFHFACI